MRKKLIFVGCILMISAMAFAEDTTTTQTCANGAGTVITGAITGHKYCKSNSTMNWWNANAWCDALGRRLFSIDDCEFSSTSGTSKCHDLNGIGDGWCWTGTPRGSAHAYDINLSSGDFNGNGDRGIGFSSYYAFCY